MGLDGAHGRDRRKKVAGDFFSSQEATLNAVRRGNAPQRNRKERVAGVDPRKTDKVFSARSDRFNYGGLTMDLSETIVLDETRKRGHERIPDRC